uniref:F5/8 type C domain-containing protein n=1 Tax=Guillardia theta TaxID=55529 RepID=A0A6U6BW00_GUITH|mmetsp:Transcript_4203/g.15487  ORF Transcript_4203/g.15487 Transcript_4203/m.15487 type:complete len:379 (+) Transcript_4203:92-1228(+)
MRPAFLFLVFLLCCSQASSLVSPPARLLSSEAGSSPSMLVSALGALRKLVHHSHESLAVDGKNPSPSNEDRKQFIRISPAAYVHSDLYMDEYGITHYRKVPSDLLQDFSSPRRHDPSRSTRVLLLLHKFVRLVLQAIIEIFRVLSNTMQIPSQAFEKFLMEQEKRQARAHGRSSRSLKGSYVVLPIISIHSQDRTLSGHRDTPTNVMSRKTWGYTEYMQRVGMGRGYRRKSPPAHKPSKCKDHVSHLLDDDGSDGPGHCWLLSDGQGGEFVVDLGSKRDIYAVAIRNTGGGGGGNRGTREFSLEVSNDMIEWFCKVKGELSNVDHGKGQLQAECFELHCKARYLRFTAESFYGKGAGLNSFRVVGYKHKGWREVTHQV